MKTRIDWLIVLTVVLASLTMAFQAVPETEPVVAVTPQGQNAPIVEPATGTLEPLLPVLAEASVLAHDPDMDDQDDPAYSLYKEGYKLMLDEQWAAARGKFNELLSKYSKSKYRVDALYWSAYSLKYSDKKKAIAAYKSFLKSYPSSNYYDDAVADLGRLEDTPQPALPPSNRYAPAATSSGVAQPELAEAVTALTNAAAKAEATAQYEVVQRKYGLTSAGVAVGEPYEDDPQVRMKVEAFQSLLRSSKDDKGFDLVKSTLLDSKQPYRMKETALFAMKQFENKDLVDLYLQVLKTDTSTMLRRHVLYQLASNADKGNEKVLEVLKQTALDTKQDRQVREAALIGMRVAKNPDAIDFFMRIAKTDPDLHFREMALYQIGQTAKPDDDAVFKALKDIALDKDVSREVREAALYSLRTVKGNKAMDFYLEVAKSDPDERIQQIALFSFVQASEQNPEKTTSVLKAIVLDKSRSWNIRESTMHYLARLPGEEGMNILLQVAMNDPEERIRMSAINYIGHAGKNKAKSLMALTTLFQNLPKDQLGPIQSLLYAIASIGGDEAVDFLAKIAKTHENYEIRRTAIQYLGNIGGEKARAVLVEIMNGK